MGYIEKSLMDGEKIIYRARLRWVVFLWPLFWLIVAIFCFSRSADAFTMAGRLFVLIALLKGIESLAAFSTSEFGVTNQRVIAKVGFIRRNSLEIFLAKIEAIQIVQSISGRIFGYGSIVVSGTGGTRDSFHNISNPLELKRKIQEQIAAVR
jgi:uncharacterized membrane protein YdbT with pleckstrin-like domain